MNFIIFKVVHWIVLLLHLPEDYEYSFEKVSAVFGNME